MSLQEEGQGLSQFRAHPMAPTTLVLINSPRKKRILARITYRRVHFFLAWENQF